jgi:hypothetical protein
MVKAPEEDDQFSDQETAARMERALKRALNTPHKPAKDGLKKTKTD